MGSVNAVPTSKVVMPEILMFAGSDILLVHGVENGREFWWPPGSYWVAEKACDLSVEQPQDWVRRVLGGQVRLELSDIRLRSVEFVAPVHPPVLVYEVRASGTPEPSVEYEFDAARYFPVSALPDNLGRDAVHGKWLRGLLDRLPPTLPA